MSINSIKSSKNPDINHLNKLPLSNNEAIMVIDIINQKIDYKRGFKNLLGFDDDEITIKFITDNRHPEDVSMVDRIGLATIGYIMSHPKDSISYSLIISYRRQLKDQSFIKIMSEAKGYESENGSIKSLFIKYTDISFMDKTDLIYWKFEADELNQEKFRNYIYKAYMDFFTNRELEIIKQLEKNIESKEIASNLFISTHTVSAHRKNIFKKSKMHNVQDLIAFCKRKGII